jgi:hypothetical protein
MAASVVALIEEDEFGEMNPQYSLSPVVPPTKTLKALVGVISAPNGRQNHYNFFITT